MKPFQLKVYQNNQPTKEILIDPKEMSIDQIHHETQAFFKFIQRRLRPSQNHLKTIWAQYDSLFHHIITPYFKIKSELDKIPPNSIVQSYRLPNNLSLILKSHAYLNGYKLKEKKIDLKYFAIKGLGGINYINRFIISFFSFLYFAFNSKRNPVLIWTGDKVGKDYAGDPRIRELYQYFSEHDQPFIELVRPTGSRLLDVLKKFLKRKRPVLYYDLITDLDELIIPFIPLL